MGREVGQVPGVGSGSEGMGVGILFRCFSLVVTVLVFLVRGSICCFFGYM